MKTNQKGAIAEQKVILKAAEFGLQVSKPIFAESRYDLIIEKNDILYKAQVKYCDSQINEAYSVSLTKHSGGYNRKLYRYSSTEIDCVLVYLPKEEKILWLPPSLWENKSSVSLRTSPSKNGQKKGINLVDDFVWLN